jgi:RNA polymerase sigma-70 factor (ECF subfamily)
MGGSTIALPVTGWRTATGNSNGDEALDQQRALNNFLRDIERRALRIAQFSTGNPDDGLDVVQEAMMGLVRRYSDRPEAEWKPLFYRILHNRLNDFHRRQNVRNRFLVITRWTRREDEEEPADVIEQAPAAPQTNPDNAMGLALTTEVMLEAIGELPKRQQEAFLLRVWEGLSVADTAKAMACSEGSVKTHYSRAVHTLQAKIDASDIGYDRNK